MTSFRFTQSSARSGSLSSTFQPEYAVYFELSLAGLVTDVERATALENIFKQVDGFHQDSVVITDHQRKSREGSTQFELEFHNQPFSDKENEELQAQIDSINGHLTSNFTKINTDLTNLYHKTSDIDPINHNLVLLQEEMSQFHADELPTLQKGRIIENF